MKTLLHMHWMSDFFLLMTLIFSKNKYSWTMCAYFSLISGLFSRVTLNKRWKSELHCVRHTKRLLWNVYESFISFISTERPKRQDFPRQKYPISPMGWWPQSIVIVGFAVLHCFVIPVYLKWDWFPQNGRFPFNCDIYLFRRRLSSYPLFIMRLFWQDQNAPRYFALMLTTAVSLRQNCHCLCDS